MEIRGISKSKETSVMRKAGLLVVGFFKVEGKLLVTSRIVQII
jgi:hypothetical protein